MKGRVETVRQIMVMKAKSFFEPEKLHRSVYSSRAEVLFRRDGRPIADIAIEGGYTGREPSDEVRTLRNYVLNNRPLIGYGGCINANQAIEWGKEREPMDLHVHITDPEHNKVIVVPSAAIRYQIGEISPEKGCSGKSLSIHEVLKEQEYLTMNAVPIHQFLVSIGKEDISQLEGGALVPNRLKTSGVDEKAPEVVAKQDLLNATSLMFTCIRSNALDKAESIATKIEFDRVLNEGTKNGYEKKSQQLLHSFWKAVNPQKEAVMPEEACVSVSMAVKN
jgi:hypothetical protein